MTIVLKPRFVLSDIKILPEEDIPRAVALAKEVFGKDDPQRLTPEDFTDGLWLFGAYEEETLLGIAALVRTKLTSETLGICHVAVVPSAQKRGIGKALVARCVSYAQETLFTKRGGTLMLTATPETVPFYEQFDFFASPAREDGRVLMLRVV